MKVTLTQNEFVSRFLAARPENFSYDALRALFTHLEELERDCGEEMEFDPVAFCCDWSEYPSAIEAAEAYGWEDPTPEGGERDSTAERAALEFLQDETAVIELSSGVLVRVF